MNGRVLVWALDDGREVEVRTGEGHVRAVSLSRGGDRVAVAVWMPDPSGRGRSMIRVSDGTSGEEILSFEEEHSVGGVKLTPDGRHVVLRVRGEIHLREVETGRAFEAAIMSPCPVDVAAALEWRVSRTDSETAIERIDDGAPVAWCPGRLERLSLGPDGRTSAAATGPHGRVLVLNRLEGARGVRGGDAPIVSPR